VRGPGAGRAPSANRLAEIVVDRVSGYANVKIDQLGALLETQAAA
jgi:hypothetical protein